MGPQGCTKKEKQKQKKPHPLLTRTPLIELNGIARLHATSAKCLKDFLLVFKYPALNYIY